MIRLRAKCKVVSVDQLKKANRLYLQELSSGSVFTVFVRKDDSPNAGDTVEVTIPIENVFLNTWRRVNNG